jgi:hypothetical protein
MPAAPEVGESDGGLAAPEMKRVKGDVRSIGYLVAYGTGVPFNPVSLFYQPSVKGALALLGEFRGAHEPIQPPGCIGDGW